MTERPIFCPMHLLQLAGVRCRMWSVLGRRTWVHHHHDSSNCLIHMFVCIFVSSISWDYKHWYLQLQETTVCHSPGVLDIIISKFSDTHAMSEIENEPLSCTWLYQESMLLYNTNNLYTSSYWVQWPGGRFPKMYWYLNFSAPLTRRSAQRSWWYYWSSVVRRPSSVVRRRPSSSVVRPSTFV